MHFSQLRAGLVVTLFFSSSMAAPTGLAKKGNTADSVASSAPILPECDTIDCDNTQASESTSGQFPRRHWHDSNEWQAPAGCEGAECNSDDWWAMAFDTSAGGRKVRRDPDDPFSSSCRFNCVSSEFP